jgi:hypothetical protein
MVDVRLATALDNISGHDPCCHIGIEVLLAEAHDVEALLLGANGFIDDFQVTLFQGCSVRA